MTVEDKFSEWLQFQMKYERFPDVLRYIEKQWLEESIARRFLRCYTRNYLHLLPALARGRPKEGTAARPTPASAAKATTTTCREASEFELEERRVDIMIDQSTAGVQRRQRGKTQGASRRGTEFLPWYLSILKGRVVGGLLSGTVGTLCVI